VRVLEHQGMVAGHDSDGQIERRRDIGGFRLRTLVHSAQVMIKKYMPDFASRERCVPEHGFERSVVCACFGELAVAEFSRM
jgi:hypothetical protein